jgi:hypothetical protein
MSEDVRKTQPEQEPADAREQQAAPKQPWETPKMEDVSEEVMAQPYIRFT